MRVSVDIGFGFVKVMNGEGKQVKFPTVLARRSKDILRGIVGGMGDDYPITYWETDNEGNTINDKFYFVGDAGITNLGTRKWEDKTEFNEEEIKVFISTAVAIVNPNNEPVDLVVGLPISYYMQKKDKLTTILKNLKANITFENDTKIKEINFNSVYVYPQGAGAYNSAILDTEGNIKDFNLANSSVGIIDIGFRTVDYMVMNKGRKGISIVENLSGSFEDEGMNFAFQQIEREVSGEIGKEIGVIEIEKAILWRNNILEHSRTNLNLTNFIEQAYKDLAEKIASKIRQKWGNEVDSLPVILITGGGGEVLYSTIKSKFSQAELQANSDFANCEGYLGSQSRTLKASKQE